MEDNDMATQVTNYQCPACTGPVHFSPETGKVVCDYCGSTYDLKEIEAIYAEKDANAATAMAEEEKKKQENAAADDGMVDALMDIIIGIRQNARKAKDWGTADAIRDQLKELGIVLEDGADGVRWKKA